MKKKQSKAKKIIINILTFKWFFVGGVWFYKKCISPLLPNSCRFYPTCSTYMLQAIHSYGVFKGIPMGLKRILRCRPGVEGGVDPVPLNPKGEIKWLL